MIGDVITFHLRVEDAIEAAAWYERLFERPADYVNLPIIAEWEVTPGAWAQVVRARPRPSAARVRFGTPDLLSECERDRRTTIPFCVRPWLSDL